VSSDLILCGDFNINHLEENSRQYHLKSLFASFNLSDIVKFPIRISNNSITLRDNFYINTRRLHFSIYPIINGLSDHNAQVLNLSFIIKEVHSQPFSFLRKTNRYSICNFKDLLSYENWEDVFLENNVNIIFNNFLNTYLRIFNTCFPVVKTHVSQKLKPWLTTGIRTSCANKRRLYESYRINNSAKFKEYYKNYCKILSALITAAKKGTLIN